MYNFITRRKFFRKTYQAIQKLTACGLLFPSLSFAKNSNSEDKLVDLAVIKGEPEKSISKAFELLGGIENFIKPNSIVLLKPNVCLPNPESWGTTTNPGVIRAVSQLALKAGAKRIIIADNTLREGEVCFSRTGIRDAINDLKKVKILSLQKESYYEEIKTHEGMALKSVKIAKLIKKSDVVINIPCAKSHVATQVSFGLKNLMGLIWDRAYFHDSTDLHTAIAELATVIRPNITILDATRALITGGPTGPGKVIELNTIIAGSDPLAVDSYTTTLSNWNNRSLSAKTVKHLYHASELGVGQVDLEKLNIRELSI